MKLKIFTLVALFTTSFAGILNAQSTITGANLNPQVGDVFITYTPVNDTSYISPGASGANATWDFHTFQFTYVDTSNFIACNSTPGCGYFNGSNLAEVYYYNNGTSADTDYGYLAANTNGLSYTGSYQAGSYIDTTVAAGYAILQYPFTYNNTFNNSYTEHDWDPTGYTGYYMGTRTVSCDGYGTLITPAGTFQNVLRVHTTTNETDSEISNGNTDVYYHRSDEYTWYMPGFHNSLADIETSADSSVGGTWGNQYYYADYSVQLSTAVASVNATGLTVDMYPNPVRDVLNVKLNLDEKQTVLITVQDLLGRQVAVMGNEVYQPGEHHITYNTASLPKGMYIVHLQSDKGSTARKMQVL